MSPSNSAAAIDVLQNIFVDIANNARVDPIERLLVLTYEFSDQQLVNLLAARALDDNFELRKNHLKFIADMQPVVIYDARKTREFSQLPHFLDLLPVNAAAYSCHHSKAYLFITEKTVRLVLGSFNLTFTGLFQNREVFVDFSWSKSEKDDLNVLRDFTALLKDGYAKWAQPASSGARHSIVATLERRLEQWYDGNAKNIHSLLASGYDHLIQRAGVDRLEALWREVSDKPPQRIFVVSPFFDRGKNFLADVVVARLGAPEEIFIVTDEVNVAVLSKRHFGEADARMIRHLSLIPAEVAQAELTRISNSNDNVRMDDLKVTRNLHAKVLVLCSGAHHLVYAGSANFTLKAWNGGNQELGVAWVAKGSADGLIASTLEALSADTKNCYSGLPDEPPVNAVEDDEDYVHVNGYPEFIDSILLEPDATGEGMHFTFSTGEPSRLNDYVIRWGSLQLEIVNLQSKSLSRDSFYTRLQGGRNLAFTPRTGTGQSFLLPFFHDATLVQQQDLFLFPSPEDWLRYYIYPESSSGVGAGEYLPGKKPPPLVPETFEEPDRENNIVVAMQRYLNLFSSVEAEFQQRAAAIASATFAALEERAEVCRTKIAEPLRVYAQLLEKERGGKAKEICEQVFCFRLGELLLLCHSLAEKLPELVPLVDSLAAGLVPRISDSSLHIYVNYCKEEVRHD
jgi:hypothetical protein